MAPFIRNGRVFLACVASFNLCFGLFTAGKKEKKRG